MASLAAHLEAACHRVEAPKACEVAVQRVELLELLTVHGGTFGVRVAAAWAGTARRGDR